MHNSLVLLHLCLLRKKFSPTRQHLQHFKHTYRENATQSGPADIYRCFGGFISMIHSAHSVCHIHIDNTSIVLGWLYINNESIGDQWCHHCSRSVKLCQMYVWHVYRGNVRIRACNRTCTQLCYNRETRDENGAGLTEKCTH